MRSRMRSTLSVLAAALALAAFGAVAEDKGFPVQAASPEAAFIDVARVLQSPRCLNCHPDGDAPLQGDRATPHAMGITRDNIEATGMTCQTCHREGAVSDDAHMPPALKGWRMPSKATPMIFQGRTPAQLCAQLKDPQHNGNHDIGHLVEHVSHDALVHYGWSPGGKRTVPPLPHDVFVARFKQWADAGAPCPP